MKSSVRRIVTLVLDSEGEHKALCEIAKVAIAQNPMFNSDREENDMDKLTERDSFSVLNAIVEIEEETATRLLNAAKEISRIAQRHQAGSNEHLTSLITCLTMEG